MMMAFTAGNIRLDPLFWSKTSRIQLLYGIWVTMSHMAIGLAFGFAAVQVPQLLSPDSEIHITRSDASWIASMLLLLCPFGCIISGFLMDIFGRRIMLIFSQVTMSVGWFYTSLAKTPEQIIVARAIIGVGCGLAMSPPRIYCTEISLPNMRGVLGVFPNVAQSIGLVLQAALGKFFHWKIIDYVCCIFTFVNFCSYALLPETPYFTLKTKSTADARANLAKFRGSNYNLDNEMDLLVDFKQYNNIRKLTFIEYMGELLSKASCKPFWLIIIYIFIGQLAGISAIMFWSLEMLTETNSSIDVYAGNIMVTVTRVFMAIITSILVYRVGRKPLALSSAMGVAVVCLTIGIFLIYNDDPSVLPVICFTLYNVFATLGYYSLPHLMAFELFPLQVRGILGGTFVSIHCLIMFASTNVQPFITKFLGVAYTFVTFAGFSLAGTVYLYFYLPETKDLTLQEIEEYYKEIRPTLVSQRRLMTTSRAAMQMKPKTESIFFKYNRDAPSLMTSKTSMLAKLEAKRQLAMLEQRENSVDFENITRIQSSDSKKSMESNKSTGSGRSRVLFEEIIDEDKDDETSKSEESMDIKESRKDEKSKEPKESSKDDEETPKDKDQASTSKKNTQ